MEDAEHHYRFIAVVSVAIHLFLLSTYPAGRAILTILQIDSAAANPISRYSALMSLVCAFMSLLYGCIYIIRFGSMRKTHKAAEWANVSNSDDLALVYSKPSVRQESEKSSTSIFWNVWVMLAMPAVWLGWYVALDLPRVLHSKNEL
jgi:hypothetical protein